MSETVRLSNFATVANAVFNSVTANATAIQSMSIGGHTINATSFAGTANNANNLGGVAAASYQLNSTLAANVAAMTANAATFANSSSTNTFTVGTAAYFVANGNVGIGTSSPSSKLSVAGVIHGQAAASSGDVLIIGNDTKLVAIDTAHIAGIQSMSNTAIGGLRFGSSGGTIFGANSNIGIATTTPTATLDVAGTLQYQYSGITVIPAPALDGSTAARAAPSAKYIQEVCRITTDGIYWINLPTVGATQIYCIMNPACSGGGWMMAIKGTRGTTFPYTSTSWTTDNTVNPTQTNRGDGDAKFHTYNHFPATDWLAIWPDLSNGGDISGGFGGWTWLELNATGTSESILAYMNRGVQITKASNGIVYVATNPGPTSLPKYGNLWSMSGGFQWYGLNYTGNSGARVRWGWATNNETEQASNDINGGIGMTYDSFSAGDRIACCQVITGINRSARFEWYVR